MNIKKLNSEDMRNIINDQSLRVGLTKESHVWFFNIYFGHYITYKAADFQHKMFSLTENENIPILGMVAFRGCAKSTIFTMSYPIWSIIGKQQKKFIIILGETQRQAKQHLINIRKELEGNELLRSDLGPFKEIEDEWGSYSLVIPKYNARITAASMEQTIRGMRHNQYRPDLIICDDIEDIQNVKTKEGRDKVEKWITGEVIPAGDLNTRIIFIGNLLHEDSLLMRIKNKINDNELNGKFYEIPLINENNNITWPGKYPDMQSIEKEKKKIGNEIAWAREYMLKIVSEEGRVVHPEWIQYYDKIEEDDDDLRYILTGVDPAITLKDSADCTAIVSAKVYGYGDKQRIYVMPNPINRRMEFPEAVDELKRIYKSLKSPILIESYGYQKALSDQLNSYGLDAEAVNMGGNDKRSRLSLSSNLIRNGQILFSKEGSKDIINQLINFGIEKHDDLADALNVIAFKAIEDNEEPTIPEIHCISSKLNRKGSLSDFWNDED